MTEISDQNAFEAAEKRLDELERRVYGQGIKILQKNQFCYENLSKIHDFFS